MNLRIAIIGAGPAGIAGSIQLKRYGFSPVVYEAKEIGGLVRNAWLIENYPGFPSGISGEEFNRLLQKQFNSSGIDIRMERVELLDYNEDTQNFEIVSNLSRRKYDIAVAATGSVPFRLEILNTLPDSLLKYIYYEIYNIISVENKRILIIGAGDIALDYALNLSRRNEVVVVNRSEARSALPHLCELADASESITYYFDSHIMGMQKSDEKNVDVLFEDGERKRAISADYVVVAIGREGSRSYFSERLRSMEAELIESRKLYLIGDIKNGIFRQIGIAVGDGIKAAMEINNDFTKRIK